MEKLPMCRICLAKNVRKHIVVNRNLHELYEKLTDIPFVTEDSRPILACFFCCTKLKQCYQFLRQCLEAEELFARRMNENYEPNPSINQNRLFRGYIKSPIVHISIVDGCQTESIAVKEELPAACDGLDDVIEPKDEHQSDELELENLDNSWIDVANIPRPPHHSESDLEDDEPLMKLRTVVEDEEVSKKKQRDWDTKKLESENLNNSCLDVADIPLHHSESDLDDDVPLMEFKTEVVEEQEVSKKKRRARETTRTIIAKKPKPETQKAKPEDPKTTEQAKKEKSDSKVLRATQKRTSKPGTYFKEPYKCDERNLNQVKQKQITRTQIGEKTKCDVCHRSFSRKGDLTNHIRTHTGVKPYKCDVCHLSFSVKGNLTRHILIHSGKKPYKCDVCQLSFNIKGNLTRHIRIHSGKKPYECDVCQRRFRWNYNLTIHIRAHTGEKPYKCDECQRSFKTKCSLKEHISKHTGEKPYKCDVCHCSFSQNSYLRQHIRIHTGVKPFNCNICQRSFSLKGNLKKHIRSIHTGEKPYKCDVCHCSFSQNSNLKQHIRIHTGVKPFNCNICQRSFSLKGNLKKHIRIHNGENP